MRCIMGVFFVFLFLFLTPVTAQYPQYYRPRAQYQEECPQGRQIRAQKVYPSTMTDCEVLDADTAAERQKLQRKLNPPPVAQQPVRPAAPKPVAPAAAVLVTPAAVPPPPAPPPPAAAPTAAASPPPPSPQVVTQPPQPPVKPAVASAPPLREDYDGRIIGNWMTSAKEDRFGDGGTFAAITGDGGYALAVRCLQKHLSIGVMGIGNEPKPMEKGDFYKFKFRVDAQPIVDAAGIVISDRLIQLDTEKALVRSIRDGKETAMRIEDGRGVSSTHVFNTNGSRRAFADLSRECPLD
jgi:hypothetical protein